MHQLSPYLLCVLALLTILALCAVAPAQTTDHEEIEQLKQMVLALQGRVSALEQQNAALRGSSGSPATGLRRWADSPAVVGDA